MKTFYILLVLALHLFNGCSDHNRTSDKKPHYETPKLVVGIIVDQMRYDYLYRYWDNYREDGFKRLLTEGFVFDNTHFDYMPTFTGPGHASVYSGTTPNNHGIIGNDWYVREMGGYTYVTDDPGVESVGTETDAGKMSPRWLLTSTIGDELRLHTNFRSKTIGVSIKDRGAILPAGHTGDAYWFDSNTGDFITSTWYYDELPQWVQKFNEQKKVDHYLGKMWKTLLHIEEYDESIEDDNSFEGVFEGQEQSVFPYNLSKLARENGPGLIATTPYGNNLIADFAYEAIEGESLGEDKFTDLLSISFSATDYIGHQFGPASIEIQDTYLRFDRQIAELLSYIDEKFGTENVLVFLTSDHGAAHVPAYLQNQDIPAGTFNQADVEEALSEYLVEEFGEDLILSFSNFQVFLDRIRIQEKNLDLGKVQKSIVRFMISIEGIAGAIPGEAISFGEFNDGIRQKIGKGYNQKRSGDVVIWLESQIIPERETGTTHGSPYTYDTRAPMIWYGWNIPEGRSTRPVYISDIASTLGIIMKTPFPNGNTGKPMNEYLQKE